MTRNQVPDDFELALRSVLHEQAAGPTPVSLRAFSLDVVERSSSSGRFRSWFAATGSVATVGVLLAVSVVASGWLMAGRHGKVGGGGPAISPSPSSAASPEAAIVLDTGVVRLTADSITIHAGDRTFEIPQGDGGGALQVHSDPGDANYRTLELEWVDQDTPMRWYLYFAADDDSWWVSEMRTYDGSSDGEWITYTGPYFEAPLGLGWAGDFDQVGFSDSVPGRLEIHGMRLNGFDPQTIPADSVNCRPLYDVEGIDLTRIEQMPPAQADAILRMRGVCHSFRYMYRLDESSGYSERWCAPPPGRIVEVTTSDDGRLVTIFVQDAEPMFHTPRPQPPQGWGC